MKLEVRYRGNFAKSTIYEVEDIITVYENVFFKPVAWFSSKGDVVLTIREGYRVAKVGDKFLIEEVK